MTDDHARPATERAIRFILLVDALRAILRQADPQLDDESLRGEAAFHADRRLRGHDLVPTFVWTGT